MAPGRSRARARRAAVWPWTVAAVALNMATLATSVALVSPITCFAVSCPVPVIPAIVATPGPRRWPSPKVFSGPTRGTARSPPCELHNQPVAIKIFSVAIVPCIISISSIGEFNKGKVVLHVHVSNSAERAAKKEQRTTSTALHERSDESHTTLLPPSSLSFHECT